VLPDTVSTAVWRGAETLDLRARVSECFGHVQVVFVRSFGAAGFIFPVGDCAEEVLLEPDRSFLLAEL